MKWEKNLRGFLFSLLMVQVLLINQPSFPQGAYKDSVLEDASDPEIHQGVEEYQRYNFQQALENFERFTQKHPQSLLGYFLQAETYWSIFINKRENTEAEKQFLELGHKVIKMGEARLKLNKNDTDTLLILASLYGRWGLLEGSYNHRWEAIMRSMKARAYFEKVIEINPEIYDAYLGLGLYDYFTATFPGYIRVFSKVLFGLYGGQEKGLRELQLAMEKGTYGKDLAKFFLAFFYIKYENRAPQALNLLKELTDQYPENLNYLGLLAYCYKELKDYEKAIRIYRKILELAAAKGVYGEESLNITTYFFGESLRLAGKYEEAKKYFDAMVHTDSTDKYWVLAYAHLSLGKIYDTFGERDKALESYRNVLALKDFEDSHKKVERYLKAPYKPGQD